MQFLPGDPYGTYMGTATGHSLKTGHVRRAN